MRETDKDLPISGNEEMELQTTSSQENMSSAMEESEIHENAQRDHSEYIEQLLTLKSRLNSDTLRMGRRFFVWLFVFLLGIIFLAVILQKVHYFLVGRYAVLEAVSVTQNAGNQGQIEIGYRVLSPGRVYCQRLSQEQKAELIYDYQTAGDDLQHWNWGYVPGKPIDVELWSRKGFRLVSNKFQFQTSDVVDIVILIDTTESMDASINALKEKCQEFAVRLEQQAVKPRFALIGFGDAQNGGEWLFETEFTSDVMSFQQSVTQIPRFMGRDLPESALDALHRAILKVKNDSKGHAIRFYLVTDQEFHSVTAAGNLNVEAITKLLNENRIMLDVFCQPRFRAAYEPLLGDCGHFREIENFGEVLSQGRFLED